MNIFFSKKEEKTGTLTYSQIDYCYLVAIKNTNPDLWVNFLTFIDRVDKEQ